jgi:hypothetical protein
MPNKNETEENTKRRAVRRVEKGKEIESRTSRAMRKEMEELYCSYNAIPEKKKTLFIPFKFGLRW